MSFYTCPIGPRVVRCLRSMEDTAVGQINVPLAAAYSKSERVLV
jgi:hypothetical protein